MKFNLTLVASLVAAGAMVSGTAFAAGQSRQGNTTPAQVKSQQAIVNQNQDGLKTYSKSNQPWYKNIHFSGELNVDASAAGRSAHFGQSGTSGMNINNATLFVDAPINNWVSANLALDYSTVNTGGAQKNYIYIDSSDGQRNGGDLRVESAYATIGDLSKVPVYFRVGKQFLNFGSYQIHPITPSLTQLMSETNATAATLGFVSNYGIYGSIYGFQNDNSTETNNTDTSYAGKKHHADDFGLNLGWNYKGDGYNFGLQAGYMYNIAAVDYIANRLPSSAAAVSTTAQLPNSNPVYRDTVGGLALDAHGNVGAFDASAHYVGALRAFNQNDFAEWTSTNAAAATRSSGARPWAVGAEVGYSFKLKNHDSRFSVGYQGSGNAVGVYPTSPGVDNSGTQLSGTMGLPQNRWLANYRFNMLKNANLEFQVMREADYNSGDGGTGRSSTSGTIRLNVMFA